MQFPARCTTPPHCGLVADLHLLLVLIFSTWLKFWSEKFYQKYTVRDYVHNANCVLDNFKKFNFLGGILNFFSPLLNLTLIQVIFFYFKWLWNPFLSLYYILTKIGLRRGEISLGFKWSRQKLLLIDYLSSSHIFNASYSVGLSLFTRPFHL